MTTYTSPSEPGRTMPRDADTIVLTCRDQRTHDRGSVCLSDTETGGDLPRS